MAVAVRPRVPWEAVDLGFRMVRDYWRQILIPWMAVVGVFALLLLVWVREIPWLAWLILWWLKPLWDRIPLFVLSRAVFGSAPNLKETLRSLPKAALPGLLGSLTFRRFSPFRTMSMPVDMLEGLKRKENSQRKSVLVNQDSGHMLLLTSILLLCEWLVLFTGTFLLVELIMPQDLNVVFWELPFSNGDWVSFTLIWLSAMTFLEPLYVAAGFSLYLNRRTLLEAWDVELAFRRLAKRLAPAAGVAVLALFLFASTPALYAQEAPPPQPDVKSALEEVMRAPEFQRYETVEGWHLREFEGGERKPSSFSFPMVLLARFFKIFLILALLAAVAYLVSIVMRRIQLRVSPGRVRESEIAIPGQIKLGERLFPETLPDDILNRARELWGQGRFRSALSLLYRGALRELSGQCELNLESCATEHECLSQVRRKTEGPAIDYFARLTAAWIKAAYADRFPLDEGFAELCDHWPRLKVEAA